MNDDLYLQEIQKRIPEFGAQRNNDFWTWFYRCDESETSFGTLHECFIDFVAKTLDMCDRIAEIEAEEDLESGFYEFYEEY